ncbi:hypothetical protein BLNAU_20134 [Blattamonas nauphoetae]|uniref:Uncharacterized protein n=1 Tax=Blattamonas nauphoetae TaxID=2049346 RepID=A0ABQ9X057_9EUKA|nr:hypothetical protein BLNAU_20134 [Blattamonas nauphoetae]
MAPIRPDPTQHLDEQFKTTAEIICRHFEALKQKREEERRTKPQQQALPISLPVSHQHTVSEPPRNRKFGERRSRPANSPNLNSSPVPSSSVPLPTISPPVNRLSGIDDTQHQGSTRVTGANISLIPPELIAQYSSPKHTSLSPSPVLSPPAPIHNHEQPLLNHIPSQLPVSTPSQPSEVRHMNSLNISPTRHFDIPSLTPTRLTNQPQISRVSPPPHNLVVQSLSPPTEKPPLPPRQTGHLMPAPLPYPDQNDPNHSGVFPPQMYPYVQPQQLPAHYPPPPVPLDRPPTVPIVFQPPPKLELKDRLPTCREPEKNISTTDGHLANISGFHDLRRSMKP